MMLDVSWKLILYDECHCPRMQYSGPGEQAGTDDGGAELKYSEQNQRSSPGQCKPGQPVQPKGFQT